MGLQAKSLALIVEDDDQVRDLAVALFEETDFDTVACDSAEGALSQMRRYGDRIGVVFADVRLPGILDGVDLARIVHSRWPQAEVILTSGMPCELLGDLPDGILYVPKPWRALDVLVMAERAQLSG